MKYKLSTRLEFTIDTEQDPDFKLQYNHALNMFGNKVNCVECALLSTVGWLADCVDFSKYTKENWMIEEV